MKEYSIKFNMQDPVNTPEFEGFREKMYYDTVGVPTIAIGFNLLRADAPAILASLGYDYKLIMKREQAVTYEHARLIMARDLEHFVEETRKLIPNFDEQPSLIQAVCVDMCYNLGAKGFRGFYNTRNHIINKNYELAAQGMERSKWYRQVGRRSKKLVEVVRSMA